MNKSESLRVIDPLKVAQKLEAIRNFLLPEVAEAITNTPRLVEAAWFLAWVSRPENYAGGLARFAQDFVSENADLIGPTSLVEKGPRKLGASEAEEILANFPDAVAERVLDCGGSSDRLIGALLDSHSGRLDPEEDREYRKSRQASLGKLTFKALQAPCIDAARGDLASFFWDFCTVQAEPELKFDWIAGSAHRRLWYWPGLWPCFFEWLDRRAERIRKSIAETSVTREVFRWLRLAEETRKGVMIVGNSRFGKTEAIRAYAAMRPGRVRIIETPSSSSQGDLLREIARAIGVEFKPVFHELRTEIDFVLRQSGVMLIFDEAQFLFPTRAGRRDDPPRLNYVRRAVMDLQLPTAFIYTPQSWRRVERNYLKASGWSIEQFEGRLLRSAVALPAELPREEMIAVARIHFPELSEKHLEYVIRPIRAIQGSILSCVESVARLARIYAREDGRDALKVADLKRALEDVLPRSIEPTPAPPLAQEDETPATFEPAPARAMRPAEAPRNRLSSAGLNAVC